MIQLSIHLYGKPEWDLSTGEENLDPNCLREQGDYLQKHLHHVAEILEKLLAKGWSAELSVYTLELSNCITEKQAKEELEELGIERETVNLREYENEE